MESLSDLSDAIERSVSRRYRSHPLYEDALQEAHIEAWRKIKDEGADLGLALHSAIFRAQNIVNGRQTFGAPERSPGSGSRKPLLQSYEAHTASNDSEVPVIEFAPESGVFVAEVLDLLSPVERFIVEAMMSGYTHAQIAEELDRSVAAVRKRMPRIRAKLEPVLEELRA